ncbi:MAG: DUF342 domain-containing protein [Polyangiaceae bacterium]|nr:DUF342 domain-containing protein [Polyangiaceae bacterium]
MDFRERGTIQNVKANTAVYECLPPTEGAAGVDVFGQIVKPRIRVDRRVKAGQNVRQEGNYLFSTLDGVLQEHGNKVSVLGVIKIMGDVNMRSGNIRAPYSAVAVSGSGQSGATISVCVGGVGGGSTSPRWWRTRLFKPTATSSSGIAKPGTESKLSRRVPNHG